MKAVEVPKIDFKFTNEEKKAVNRMKAVLVIGEMPKNCSDCWLHRNEYSDYEKVWEDICHNAEHECHVLSKTNYIKRPSWCPLKPLPKKIKHKDEIDYDYGYIDGRNECIDEITGETEWKE